MPVERARVSITRLGRHTAEESKHSNCGLRGTQRRHVYGTVRWTVLAALSITHPPMVAVWTYRVNEQCEK